MSRVGFGGHGAPGAPGKVTGAWESWRNGVGDGAPRGRTIFGRHGVNIAQMAVGRAAPGGEAVGVLNLDSEPRAEALTEVRQLPAITSAVVVHLPPAGQLPAWAAVG